MDVPEMPPVRGRPFDSMSPREQEAAVKRLTGGSQFDPVAAAILRGDNPETDLREEHR